jgi:hypothetical protein
MAFEAGLRAMEEAMRDKNEKSGFRGVKEKSERY